MKVFLIIVLVLILLPVAFFIFALVANIFLLATGRMTKEELNKNVMDYKGTHPKKERNHSSIWGSPSYPEPIRKALGSWF